MSSITTGFRLSGQYLTSIVRQTVLSGDWRQALDILMEGLEGMHETAAFAVMRGDAVLVDAADGLEFQEEEDLAYKAEVEDVYLSMVYRDHKRQDWKAYGVIDAHDGKRPGLGTIDYVRGDRTMIGDHSDAVYFTMSGRMMTAAMLAAERPGTAPRPSHTYRFMHYARDPARDRLHLIDRPPAGHRAGVPYLLGVLFERVHDLPPWLTPATSPEEAVADELPMEMGSYLTYGLPGIETVEALGPERLERVNEDGFVAVSMRAGTPEELARVEYRALRERMRGTASAPVSADDITGNSSIPERYMREQENHVAAEASEETLRDAILAKADQIGGYLDLSVPAPARAARPDLPETLRIPAAPFRNWALWRTAGAHLAPSWRSVSPRGLKQMNDDPFHSDWMIGAGLSLDALDHDTPGGPELREAVEELFLAVQKEALGVDCAVLCGRGAVTGTVVHLAPGEVPPSGSIAVIPHAGPAYAEAAMAVIADGGAVITERGGAMAHLVTIGRGEGLRLVRVPDARHRFPEGARLTVNCETGQAELDTGPLRLLSPFESGPFYDAEETQAPAPEP